MSPVSRQLADPVAGNGIFAAGDGAAPTFARNVGTSVMRTSIQSQRRPRIWVQQADLQAQRPFLGDFFASHADWRAAVTSQSPKRGMGADRRAEEREPPLGSDPIPKQEDGAGLAMDIMSRTSAALCPFFNVPQPNQRAT